MTLTDRTAARGRGLVFAGALALLAAAGAAADTHPCSRITDPAQRLACFDRHHPPPVQPATVPASAARAGDRDLASPAPSPAPAAAARFGLPPDPSERARELESISAVVQEIGSLRHGERVFVLDNGQRWAERVAETRGPLNPGDRITITRASFGSFLLVTPAGAGLRVRRLP